jgi:hypothetical protein
MFLQIKHLNTTINRKEFTTFLHKINPEIHLSLHLILNCSPQFSPVVRPWRYVLHFPSRIAPKYSLIVMLVPPHLVYSIFDVFRPDIGGITSGLFICLTTACWYMCLSGKSLNALVARDKTRSAQSSRSSSGVWRALLNWTWAVFLVSV